MSIFQEKVIRMGLEFQVQDDKVCYTPLKDKCEYDLQKKSKKFRWTEEAEKAFNDIKELLVSPPVLKAPTPDGLFA